MLTLSRLLLTVCANARGRPTHAKEEAMWRQSDSCVHTLALRGRCANLQTPTNKGLQLFQTPPTRLGTSGCFDDTCSHVVPNAPLAPTQPQEAFPARPDGTSGECRTLEGCTTLRPLTARSQACGLRCCPWRGQVRYQRGPPSRQRFHLSPSQPEERCNPSPPSLRCEAAAAEPIS